MEKSFQITSVCKKDIVHAFHNSEILEAIKKKVAELDDSDMKKLASKMADDYCDQLFWNSLRIICEELFKMVRNKK